MKITRYAKKENASKTKVTEQAPRRQMIEIRDKNVKTAIINVLSI